MLEVLACKPNDCNVIHAYYKTLVSISIDEEAVKFEKVSDVFRVCDEHGHSNYLFVGENNYYYIEMLNDEVKKVNYFKINENNIMTDLITTYSDIVIVGGAVSRINELYAPIEQIVLLKSDDVTDKYRYVNANLVYIQYNYKDVLRCSMFNKYNASFDGRDKIGSSCFNVPYVVTVDQFVKLLDKNPKVIKKYFLAEWEKNQPCFDFALLKAFGLKNYSAVKKGINSFSMYYDNDLANCDNAFGSLLFSHNYTDEKMKSNLSTIGFKSEVSQDMIDMFNGEHDVYKLCRNLALQVDNLGLDDNLKLYLKR